MSDTENNLETSTNRLLLLALMNAAYRRTVETPDDVFFEYSPHVNAVFVRIFLGGWRRDYLPQPPTYQLSYAGPHPTPVSEIRRVIDLIDQRTTQEEGVAV